MPDYESESFESELARLATATAAGLVLDREAPGFICKCIGCCRVCGSCLTWSGHTPECCKLRASRRAERVERPEHAAFEQRGSKDGEACGQRCSPPRTACHARRPQRRTSARYGRR